MFSEVRYDGNMVGKEMRGRREVWIGWEVSWQVWVGKVSTREGKRQEVDGKLESRGVCWDP